MNSVTIKNIGKLPNWAFRTATILIAWIVVTVSPLQAEDYTGSIAEHAQRYAPPGTSVDPSKIEYLAFPGEGSGRLSVKGAYVARTDLIKPNGRYPQLRARLVELGYSVDEIQTALQTFDDYTPYGGAYFAEAIVSVPRGTEIPFRAELRYLETIDGIRINGAIEFQYPVGQPVLPNDHYVVGTADFATRVQEVQAAIEEARLALGSGGQIGDGIVQKFQGARVDMFPSSSREAPWTLFEIVIPEREQSGGTWEDTELSRYSDTRVYKRVLSAQVKVVSGIRVGNRELQEGTLLPLNLTFLLDQNKPDISGLMLRYEVTLDGKKIFDQPSGGTKFLENNGTSYQGTAKLDLYLNDTVFGGLYERHVIVLAKDQQS